MIDLNPHRLKVALMQPQIAPNTGNIARLCVACGAALHLVRPLGFVLDDRQIKRSGMDYWPRVKLTVHDDDAAFWAAVGSDRVWLFSTKGGRGFWQADFHEGDWLIFGSETRGLSDSLLARRAEQVIRIPQVPGERCLNLSTAAGIGLYEALRQVSLTPP